MKDNDIEHLSLFDVQASEEETYPSALPDSATGEWKKLYAAISKYGRQLRPTTDDK